MSRKAGFAAMLAVIGMSIVFGMILGGWLNTPRVVLAAREVASRPGPEPAAFPPGRGDIGGFADIAEVAIPAVVSVTNTAVNKDDRGGEDPHELFRDDPMFRWFFGPPENRQSPQQERKVQSGGSGFIVSSDGYILTNNHVVENSTKLQVHLNDGTDYVADIVGTDPNIDLALIKVDPKGKSLPYLPLGDSDKLRVGEWVIAIGNPLQLSETVTVGVVSAKNRRFQIGDTDNALTNFLQTDAAINFGNSGGPLLDAQGRVVGINTAINRNMFAEGIGFALPINQAKSAMEQLRETGKVRRGYMGIQMSDVTQEAMEYEKLPDRYGVIVARVEPKGPAAKAGLQEEDIIRKIDGNVVKDGQDLLSRVASKKPGDDVDLEILRQGKTINKTLTLAARPDAKTLRAARGAEGGGQEGEEEPENSASTLGITVQALTPSLRSQLELGEDVRGVVITDVEVGSEAQSKGLGPRLVVVSVNEQPVRSLKEWREAIASLKPSSVAKIRTTDGERFANYFLRVPSDKK
jgi:serine protease Do